MTWLDAVSRSIRVEGSFTEEELADQGRLPATGETRRLRPPGHAAIARGPATVGERASLVSAAALAGVSFADSPGLLDIIYPSEPEAIWRAEQLDSETLSRTRPARLLELLSDISPEISRAIWDFLRMCNPGWTATVVGADGITPRPGREQQALNQFLADLVALHGSLDVVIARMYMSAFLRGAFLGELILDPAGRLPLNIETPDPALVLFRRVKDTRYGTVHQLGQLVNGAWRRLDYATIRYLPVDPAPGSPYGRPLASPAVFSSIFLLGLLHDLRRVVAQQGYPRIDVSIDLQQIKEGMPEDYAEDPDAYRQWVADAIADIRATYAQLEPDDAFIHTSAVSVNRPVGAVDSSSLGSVGTLISNLERQLIRALKTMPLLMGTNEGATETHANRQWEVHVAGIKALQHLAESLLEHLLKEALRAQGLQATVKFRFAELRASEELRDAQTRQIKTINAWNAYVYGFSSHEDASMYAVGHLPANDGPLYMPGNLAPIEQFTLAGEVNPASEAAVGDGAGRLWLIGPDNVRYVAYPMVRPIPSR